METILLRVKPCPYSLVDRHPSPPPYLAPTTIPRHHWHPIVLRTKNTLLGTSTFPNLVRALKNSSTLDMNSHPGLTQAAMKASFPTILSIYFLLTSRNSLCGLFWQASVVIVVLFIASSALILDLVFLHLRPLFTPELCCRDPPGACSRLRFRLSPG